MEDHDVDFLTLQRALVGRYSLVREIGRGGMGVVFLARDVALDRPVAIKVLPTALAVDPRFRAQFLREARLAGGLAHPNIVPIHAVEEVGDHVFFVMGYVDGESLGARVRRLGPLPQLEALSIVRQAAMGLAHAHARGVVHRDVKPDNILIERDGGRALVTDFGIARGINDASEGTINAGTPHYLSPEVAAGGEGSAASDLYALGVTAWFALTGGHPHHAQSVAALLVDKLRVPAPALASVRPGLPLRLTGAIDRALAHAAVDRWPDLDRFAAELATATAAPPTPPVVRAFVRTASSLGRDTAASATVVASSLGIMALLGSGDSLFNAIFAQAVMAPIAIVAASFQSIRLAQVAMSAIDVVRQGQGHPAVAAALRQERRDQELEAEARPLADRRRDAFFYGALGAVKSAAAFWLAASNGPDWLTIPAAAAASVVPALTLLKVNDVLRPGAGRWPRWLSGRPGHQFFRLVSLFTRHPKAHQLPATPTVMALGGEIAELFEALPGETRGAVSALPQLVDGLQREADALRARPRSDDTDARLGTIAMALETIRVELLSLQAGLGTVRDVTSALEQARVLGAYVDGAIGALPEITPA